MKKTIAVFAAITMALSVSAAENKVVSLKVTKNFAFSTSTAFPGAVLTSDANGKAAWADAPGVFGENSSGAYYDGNVGIGTQYPHYPLSVFGTTYLQHLRLAIPNSPASTDSCEQGYIAWDAEYIYICTSPNVYKRSALTAY